jgi:hypothetical protein
MSVKNGYTTIGPVPVMYVADIMAQVEENGWEVAFLASAGFVDLTTPLQIAKQPPVPAFVVVARRSYREGEKLEPMKLKIGGVDAINNKGR